MSEQALADLSRPRRVRFVTFRQPGRKVVEAVGKLGNLGYLGFLFIFQTSASIRFPPSRTVRAFSVYNTPLLI